MLAPEATRTQLCTAVMASRNAFVASTIGLGAGLIGLRQALAHNDMSNDYVSNREKMNIVVVGGGIMGSFATYLLSNMDGYRVTWIDAAHPIRGSWGETRAMHLTIDDDLKLKMNKFNIQEYIRLQKNLDAETDISGNRVDDTVLVKKVGRVFVGATDSVLKMHHAATENGIPIEFVDSSGIGSNGLVRPHQIEGVAIWSDQDWRTIYTPAGYVLKADAILSRLRELIERTARNPENTYLNVLHDEEVVAIDRTKKIITTMPSGSTDAENPSKADAGRLIKYDKLLLCCGPWTNRLLQLGNLSMMPVMVSNEQTSNFCPKSEKGDSHGKDIALVTYSEGGYVSGTGEYWFIVPSCGIPGIKVGYHRQGTLMDNAEFILPRQVRLSQQSPFR